jgi:hypothetical protein
MKIVVTVEETNRTATVVEREYTIPPTTVMPIRESKHFLAGGESRTFYIHAAKTLEISEDPEFHR